MKRQIDTDSLSIKELDGLIWELQGELDVKKVNAAKERRRRALTMEERMSRLRKSDSIRHPDMVRIFDEENKNSFIVPFRMADTGYKLVKAYDFRKCLRKHMPLAWAGGYREGEQAQFWDVPHSEDGKVLICGMDAFKDGGEEDFNHPRFAV